jgi:hypothetical protein
MSHPTSSIDFADFQSSSTQESVYSHSQGSESTNLLLSQVPSPQTPIIAQSPSDSPLQGSTSGKTTLVLRPSVTVWVNHIRARTFLVHASNMSFSSLADLSTKEVDYSSSGIHKSMSAKTRTAI